MSICGYGHLVEKLGYLFGLFMVCLWSVRLIVEFFKEAQVDQRGEWDLNTGQLLSIPMILVGFYFMFRKSKMTKYALILSVKKETISKSWTSLKIARWIN